MPAGKSRVGFPLFTRQFLIGRVAAFALAGGLGAALFAVGSGFVGLPAAFPPEDVLTLLISTEGACAAMVAILAAVVHRLAPDPNAAWISAAFALYGIAGLPLFAVDSAMASSDASPVGAVRFFACVVVVVLLLVASHPPRRQESVRPIRIAAVGIVVLAPATIVTMAWSAAAGFVTGGFAGFIVAVAGVLAGALLWFEALRQRSSELARVGAGVTVIAIADAVWIRLVRSGSDPAILVVASCRLLGVMLALMGMGALAHVTLRSVREADARCREQLRILLAGGPEDAERERELRARLDGLTELLARPVDDKARQADALRLELAQLESLLSPVAATGPHDPAGAAVVES